MNKPGRSATASITTMSKNTFAAAAAASMSFANQGQPSPSVKPAGAGDSQMPSSVYKPYSTPYTGVGQVICTQKPMAASGFKVVDTYYNGGAPGMDTPVIGDSGSKHSDDEYDADSDEAYTAETPTLEEFWSEAEKEDVESGKLIKSPDGGFLFSQSYLDKVNNDARAYRTRVVETDYFPHILCSTRENKEEEDKYEYDDMLMPPAPAPTPALGVVGKDDWKSGKSPEEARAYIIRRLGGTNAKDMAVTLPYDPDRDEELVVVVVPRSIDDDYLEEPKGRDGTGEDAEYVIL